MCDARGVRGARSVRGEAKEDERESDAYVVVASLRLLRTNAFVLQRRALKLSPDDTALCVKARRLLEGIINDARASSSPSWRAIAAAAVSVVSAASDLLYPNADDQIVLIASLVESRSRGDSADAGSPRGQLLTALMARLGSAECVARILSGVLPPVPKPTDAAEAAAAAPAAAAEEKDSDVVPAESKEGDAGVRASSIDSFNALVDALFNITTTATTEQMASAGTGTGGEAEAATAAAEAAAMRMMEQMMRAMLVDAALRGASGGAPSVTRYFMKARSAACTAPCMCV